MSTIFNPLLINLIYFLPLILLGKFTWYLIKISIYRSKHLFRYKIHNFIFSWSCVLAYILFFFILTYLSRISDRNKILDLKEIYSCFLLYSKIEIDLSQNIKIYFLCILINICIIVIFLMIKIHKICSEEIYKLYLYFNYKQNYFCEKYIKNLILFLSKISHDDVLQFLTSKGLLYSLNKQNKKTINELSKYNLSRFLYNIFHSRIYNIIFTLSPILLVIYDCFFHNFIIIHLYYYLLFYVPIRIFKRITKAAFELSGSIGNLFWEIYYQKEICIYAISANMKPLLDDYIVKGLVMNIDVWTDGEMYLYNSCAFIPIQHDSYTQYNNLYCNQSNVIIHRDKDNSIIQIDENQDGFPIAGQKWILLLDKSK